MTSIEGISKETVEAVKLAFTQEPFNVGSGYTLDDCLSAAITALLASGEVVLRKDVECLWKSRYEYITGTDANSEAEIIDKMRKDMEELMQMIRIMEKNPDFDFDAELAAHKESISEFTANNKKESV